MQATKKFSPKQDGNRKAHSSSPKIDLTTAVLLTLLVPAVLLFLTEDYTSENPMIHEFRMTEAELHSKLFLQQSGQRGDADSPTTGSQRDKKNKTVGAVLSSPINAEQTDTIRSEVGVSVTEGSGNILQTL